MSKPTVAILGASRDPRKFGNKSVRAHLLVGYQVFPINPHASEIEGIPCYPDLGSIPVTKLDRISIYLPPHQVQVLLEDIHRAGASEVWFNPGSDSPAVVAQAEKLGIPVIRACSIVDVGINPGGL
jgi:uncharacterized protein